MFKLWWHRFTTKRTVLRFCDWDTANKLLDGDEGWEIAKEEDTNDEFYTVYLELRE